MGLSNTMGLYTRPAQIIDAASTEDGGDPNLVVLLCEACRCALPLNASQHDEATQCEWLCTYRHSLRPDQAEPCPGPLTWAPDHIQVAVKLGGPEAVHALMPPGWFTSGSLDDPGTGQLWPKDP